MAEAAIEPNLDNKPVVSLEATVEVEEPVEELVQESLQEVISDFVQETAPELQVSAEAVVDELLVVETSPKEVAGTVEADMVPSFETVVVVEEAPKPTSEAIEAVAVEVAGTVDPNTVPRSETLIVVEEASEPASEAVEVVAVKALAESLKTDAALEVLMLHGDQIGNDGAQVAGMVEADTVPSCDTVIVVEEVVEGNRNLVSGTQERLRIQAEDEWDRTMKFLKGAMELEVQDSLVDDSLLLDSLLPGEDVQDDVVISDPTRGRLLSQNSGHRDTQPIHVAEERRRRKRL